MLVAQASCLFPVFCFQLRNRLCLISVSRGQRRCMLILQLRDDLLMLLNFSAQVRGMHFLELVKRTAVPMIVATVLNTLFAFMFIG